MEALVVLASVFWATGVGGFGVAPCGVKQSVVVQHSSTVLGAIRCYDKYYQLEELEDRESCTTELYLRGDGVVEFGETDGPKYIVAAGTWSVPQGTNDYNMVITRIFGAGNDSRNGQTGMGEFTFEVTKTYRGDMTMVGESVGVTGIISSTDPIDNSEREVGYFNMIDATNERAGTSE